jgi:HAD superfamily hydrolase (TIGR01509 family)
MEHVKRFIKENKIKALLFDLNGTMIDDQNFHIEAWHKLINKMGRVLTIEETRPFIYGRNEELIERVFPGKYTLDEKVKIGYDKEAQYRIDFLPSLKLIEGLGDFLQYAKEEGLTMAIGSAAIIPNIDYVLDHCDIRHYFEAIVSGEDVSNSKPDPEVFLKCANTLRFQPEQCLVFEDVPAGVDAAVRAGMKAVVITSSHHQVEFVYFEKHVVGYMDNYL